MFLFDPRVGTGATLGIFNRRMLVELSLQNADAAAERGDDMMADDFWQMGMMVNA